MKISELEGIIEGLLFVSGDPLSLEKIGDILELSKKDARLLMNSIVERINNTNRGIIIREINNAYQLSTRPEHYEYISRLHNIRQKQSLSQAAFETLSIIAYNAPVTRAKIESIRGVNSDSSITTLLERNLIKEAGRMDTPGKPILYETTEEFLRCFGFKSIKDMPLLEIDIPTDHIDNSIENT